MPELVEILLRDDGGKLPAGFQAILSASGMTTSRTVDEAVAANFGYSDALYLSELSKRASLMKPTTKNILVEAAMRMPYSSGRPETRDRAQRLIKSTTRPFRRCGHMAKNGRPEGLKRVT